MKNIEFQNVDYKDAPDYTDAFISYAEVNGIPLTETELYYLNEDVQEVHDLLIQYLN